MNEYISMKSKVALSKVVLPLEGHFLKLAGRHRKDPIIYQIIASSNIILFNQAKFTQTDHFLTQQVSFGFKRPLNEYLRRKIDTES